MNRKLLGIFLDSHGDVLYIPESVFQYGNMQDDENYEDINSRVFSRSPSPTRAQPLVETTRIMAPVKQMSLPCLRTAMMKQQQQNRLATSHHQFASVASGSRWNFCSAAAVHTASRPTNHVVDRQRTGKTAASIESVENSVMVIE